MAEDLNNAKKCIDDALRGIEACAIEQGAEIRRLEERVCYFAAYACKQEKCIKELEAQVERIGASYREERDRANKNADAYIHYRDEVGVQFNRAEKAEAQVERLKAQDRPGRGPLGRWLHI